MRTRNYKSNEQIYNELLDLLKNNFPFESIESLFKILKIYNTSFLLRTLKKDLMSKFFPNSVYIDEFSNYIEDAYFMYATENNINLSRLPYFCRIIFDYDFSVRPENKVEATKKIITYPINSIVEFTTDYTFLLQQKYFIERHKNPGRNLSKIIDFRLKDSLTIQAYHSTTHGIVGMLEMGLTETDNLPIFDLILYEKICIYHFGNQLHIDYVNAVWVDLLNYLRGVLSCLVKDIIEIIYKLACINLQMISTHHTIFDMSDSIHQNFLLYFPVYFKYLNKIKRKIRHILFVLAQTNSDAGEYVLNEIDNICNYLFINHQELKVDLGYEGDLVERGFQTKNLVQLQHLPENIYAKQEFCPTIDYNDIKNAILTKSKKFHLSKMDYLHNLIDVRF